MNRLIDLIIRGLRRLFSRAGRLWQYGIAIAAIALGIQQGWFTEETGALILPLVVAILHVPGKGIDMSHLDRPRE